VAGWTVADFLTSQRPGEYDARAWKIATRCDLLILDDLGQEMGIGWEKEKARETIHRLLDTRARHGKRTIITTNRSGEWIEECYGSALADRFVHDALPLVFEGQSRRTVRDWGDLG
jgi:DNA replication protein DnaC